MVSIKHREWAHWWVQRACLQMERTAGGDNVVKKVVVDEEEEDMKRVDSLRREI